MIELVFVEEKPMAGRIVHPDDEVTIGREGCDVMLADPEVSRRHAVIREQDVTVSVEDLGSKNGTFVNEERITGVTTLSRGDRVRFGNTVWRIEAPSAATRVADVEA
jgi:pSer/pThr/pTyr-binding forkhead associated (FHA) protein